MENMNNTICRFQSLKCGIIFESGQNFEENFPRNVKFEIAFLPIESV